MDFAKLGKQLNQIFSLIMLLMALLSFLIILVKGFDATYFQGSNPLLPSFGYRVRTVMLYFSLGYIASSRFKEFKGIPVALSCILIQHAFFEFFYHIIAFEFVIARSGYQSWIKDIALYFFMFSTSVYVVPEIDSKKLLTPGPVRKFLIIGILLFLVIMPIYLLEWQKILRGLINPFHAENIPLTGLPLEEVSKLIILRFIHFTLKYSLFHIMTALSMSFKETE